MADIDFEQFMQVLDAALGSDDPNVKKALRKFLFVAALAMGDDVEPGPFSDMLKTMDRLNQRINDLESRQTNDGIKLGGGTTTTGYPQWYYDPNFYGGTSGGTGNNITYGGSSGCTGFTTTTGTTTYTVDLGLEPEGEKIEREIKEKLESLLK